MKTILATAILMLTLPAQAKLIATFAPTHDAEMQLVRNKIKHSDITDTLINLSRQYFPFEKDLTISYGSDDGPLYDPETNIIHIPYEFYAQTETYFRANGYEARLGRSPEQGALDTLLHTLLHEAAHAYIANQDIAVLGKEEDAADDFATIMLLSGVENGDDIALSAADMFVFEANDLDRPDYYEPVEYIDEHSLDLQRYFATICLIYGSDPDKYAGLLDEVGKENSEERESYCQMRFEEVNRNWQRYLP